jgi:hypothetical protein
MMVLHLVVTTSMELLLEQAMERNWVSEKAVEKAEE